MKVTWETKKIFGLSDDEIKISCTSVRIPIMRAHSEAITIETEKPITPNAVRYVCMYETTPTPYFFLFSHYMSTYLFIYMFIIEPLFLFLFLYADYDVCYLLCIYCHVIEHYYPMHPEYD